MTPQTIWTIAFTLGCLSENEGKTLLMKTHTGYWIGWFELDLICKPPAYTLLSMIPESTLQAAKGLKQLRCPTQRQHP